MKAVADFLSTATKKVYSRGEQPTSVIDAAEQQLALTFPQMLRDYLQQYGALSYGSVEILGLGVPETSYRNLVTQTTELRQRGLPHEFVVIEDQGEGFFTLVAPDGRIWGWNIEAPSTPPSGIAENLDEYLVHRLQSA
jgi:hypothetical protein